MNVNRRRGSTSAAAKSPRATKYRYRLAWKDAFARIDGREFDVKEFQLSILPAKITLSSHAGTAQLTLTADSWHRLTRVGVWKAVVLDVGELYHVEVLTGKPISPARPIYSFDAFLNAKDWSTVDNTVSLTFTITGTVTRSVA